MSLDYAHEKLTIAVEILATSPSDIKDRIETAFNSSIIHIFPEDLPEDLGEKLKNLQNQVTRINAEGNEGTLKATMKTISEEEAFEIAKKILDLFLEVNNIFSQKKT